MNCSKLKIIILYLLLVLFSGCTQNNVESNIQGSFGLSYRSPYNSSEYIGMNKDEVAAALQKTGFSNIKFVSIDDITSKSDVADGSVESVVIDGQKQYGAEEVFAEESEIVITFHNIPKITIPLALTDLVSKYYMDAGKLLSDAGFINVKTDEKHDLEKDDNYKTLLLLNDSELNVETLPFDSEITVEGHYPISTYELIIDIDFEANWIFSKYDVDVMVDDHLIGTMEHGTDTAYNVNLPTGKYRLGFYKNDDHNICGTVDLNIDSNTSVKYQISCNSQNVKVQEKDYSSSVKTNELLMPYNSDYFLRKNFKTVEEALSNLGFVDINVETTTNKLWNNEKIGDVVEIMINDKTSFHYDEIFDRKSKVTIRYHVADYVFEQTELNVTERDVFNIDYSISTNDDIDLIDFVISEPNVLSRNDDGTYTALSPGSVTVTARSHDFEYSKCIINVDKLIIPIEKLIFENEELTVSVGSSFDLGFKYIPEDANVTEIRVEKSNENVEIDENYNCYSNLPGDTELAFYQEERLLGHCIVHAEEINIDEVIFEQEGDEMYLGDELNLKFKLVPESATNKGIVVRSSDTDIAEVSFDERGPSEIKVKAVKAGDVKVLLSLPNGSEYEYELKVCEILPTEITIINKTDKKRIEVGDEIKLEASWEPKNVSFKELEWSSSNKKIIEIDSEGAVKAVGLGTATITAEHRSGVSASIDLNVEPTLVTSIIASRDMERGEKLYIGSKFTVLASVFPENATNQSFVFSSDDETVAKVSDRGVVTATGVGSTKIRVESPDGPSDYISIVVSQAPQNFKITWSASLINKNHVGSSWSKSFYIDGEEFGSGRTILLEPDSFFTIYFEAVESDTNPDVGKYTEKIEYSDDLCRNGKTISETVYVRENSGRYSGNYAEWSLNIKIIPVK